MRYPVVFSLALTLALATLCPAGKAQENETGERDRTPAEWLQALRGEEVVVSQEAAWNLSRFGRDAVPVFQQGLADRDARTRAAAAYGLSFLGAYARPALAGLGEQLRDADAQVRVAAAAALWAIDRQSEKTLPVLVVGLTDRSAEVRRRAAWALQFFGRKARPAIAPLIGALNDADADVRGRSARALGRIGPDAASVVPQLLRGLADKDNRVQAACAEALGNIGARPDECLPALAKLLNSRQPTVERRAFAALEQFGPAGRVALTRAYEPMLKEGFRRGKTPAQRWEFVGMVVAYLPPISLDCLVDEAVRALRDDDLEIRSGPLWVLFRSAFVPPEAVSGLRKTLDDPYDGVREMAAVLLGRMDRHRKEVIDRMIGELRSPDPLRVTSAGRVLAELGAADPAAISLLVRALEHERGFVRRQTARTLCRLGQQIDRVVPVLIAGLTDQDEEVEKVTYPADPVGAADLLAAIGPGARAALPDLTKALHSPRHGVRIATAQALWRVSGKPEEALPVLAEIVQCRAALPEVTVAAVVALGRMGEAARPATPILARLLFGEQPEAVRQAVVEALLRIDPEEAVRAGLR
jgi:HEAT repeat protein